MPKKEPKIYVETEKEKIKMYKPKNIVKPPKTGKPWSYIFKDGLMFRTLLIFTTNIATLTSDIEKEKLDLKPYYQRSGSKVWDLRMKSDLISSLINGNSIKTIYLAKRKDESKRYCIDGKQRLTTIVEFQNNMFPLIDPKEKILWYFKKANEYPFLSSHFKDYAVGYLAENDREQFPQIMVSIHLVEETTEKEEMIAFCKSQVSSKLSSAEMMRGFDTPLMEFVIQTLDKEFGQEFRKFFPRNTGLNRGSEIQYFAWAALCASGHGRAQEGYDQPDIFVGQMREKLTEENKKLAKKIIRQLLDNQEKFFPKKRVIYPSEYSVDQNAKKKYIRKNKYSLYTLFLLLAEADEHGFNLDIVDEIFYDLVKLFNQDGKVRTTTFDFWTEGGQLGLINRKYEDYYHRAAENALDDFIKSDPDNND